MNLQIEIKDMKYLRGKKKHKDELNIETKPQNPYTKLPNQHQIEIPPRELTNG